MVLVSVSFCFGSLQWTHTFAVRQGSCVRELRKLILDFRWKAADGPQSVVSPSIADVEQDMDVFELRRSGKHVADEELVWEDIVFDFKFLGAARGGARAARRRRLQSRPVATGGKTISVHDAVRLQKALIAGFCCTDFQTRLSELRRQWEGNLPAFNVERRNLLLTVQSAVLPQFGFEGTAKGVFEMIDVLGKKLEFNDHPAYAQNGVVINRLLGMDGQLEYVPEPSDVKNQVNVYPNKSFVHDTLQQLVRIASGVAFQKRIQEIFNSPGKDNQTRANERMDAFFTQVIDLVPSMRAFGEGWFGYTNFVLVQHSFSDCDGIKALHSQLGASLRFRDRPGLHVNGMCCMAGSWKGHDGTHITLEQTGYHVVFSCPTTTSFVGVVFGCQFVMWIPHTLALEGEMLSDRRTIKLNDGKAWTKMHTNSASARR